MKKDNFEDINKKKNEANTCMAIGAGVGVLGTVTAAITGAVCPLCIVIAPGLIGIGAYKRSKLGFSSEVGGVDEKSKA